MGWNDLKVSTLFTGSWPQGNSTFLCPVMTFLVRNVLLEQFFRAKVSDFGLVAPEGKTVRRGEKLPVKWTSPEALFQQEFTSR